MRVRALACAFCGEEHGPGNLCFCGRCGGTLDVRYEAGLSAGEQPGAAGRGLWKYRRMLPIEDGTEPVTLGEGGTPLVAADRLGARLGVKRLFVKNETANPTLSFKDRPLSVAMTRAVELGARRIVLASTGNTGVAAAAYAARAGIPCSVYVPAGTPPEKTALMRLCGAAIREAPGTFSDAYEQARLDAAAEGSFNVTSTFLNPYACEGDKTVAYELCEDLRGAPDWVIVPVGAGPLLAYCLKGFDEMARAGIIPWVPRMAAVQAAGCAPIVRAFDEGADEVRPWDSPRTVAGGVADPLTTYPRDGTRTLRAVRESGGCAVAVPEEAIMEHVCALARLEGLCAEPAAALSVAAAGIMRERGFIVPGQSVVAVVTGHGAKDMGRARGQR